jgi:hypothetical protein
MFNLFVIGMKGESLGVRNLEKGEIQGRLLVTWFSAVAHNCTMRTKFDTRLLKIAKTEAKEAK